MNNDEIIDKKFPRTDDNFGINNVREALNVLMNEARAETAREIFKELENEDTGYGDICFDSNRFEQIKRKYKVQE